MHGRVNGLTSSLRSPRSPLFLNHERLRLGLARPKTYQDLQKLKSARGHTLSGNGNISGAGPNKSKEFSYIRITCLILSMTCFLATPPRKLSGGRRSLPHPTAAPDICCRRLWSQQRRLPFAAVSPPRGGGTRGRRRMGRPQRQLDVFGSRHVHARLFHQRLSALLAGLLTSSLQQEIYPALVERERLWAKWG